MSAAELRRDGMTPLASGPTRAYGAVRRMLRRLVLFGLSISLIPRTSSSTAFRADHGIYEVRFCPESGSSRLQAALPKSANSGLSMTLLARAKESWK